MSLHIEAFKGGRTTIARRPSHTQHVSTFVRRIQFSKSERATKHPHNQAPTSEDARPASYMGESTRPTTGPKFIEPNTIP